MSVSDDFRWRVMLQAMELAAAWRCNVVRAELTADLRYQLDKLVAVLDSFPRPMGVSDADAS